MKIKVLCNDSQRFAEIKRAAIEKDPDAEVSGGGWRIEELPAFIDGSRPDVLIIDQATPACLDTLEILIQRRPDIDVVLISTETSVDFLMRAMRANVREVLPTELTNETLQRAIGRIQQKRSQVPGIQGEGKVLAFISCKGGSGATFIAANLAYALATERKQRVALIDLNLQFGDVSMFVSDQIPRSNVAEVAREIHRLDASFLTSAMLEVEPGLHVLSSPEDPSSAPDVKREHVDAIIRLARSKYDFVVVDVARTLDAITLQALDMADYIFPVLQLTLPFIRDSKRLINVFRSLDYHPEQIRLIVSRYRKGGEISLKDIERTVGLKVFMTLPNSYQAAATSVNLGIPIIKGQRADPISKALIDMAYKIVPAEEDEKARKGWLPRIFS